jgi:glutathione synthase/RimK-type ligase-like ATP-grasp enzyme
MKRKLVFWSKMPYEEILSFFSTKPEYHAFFTRCSERFEFRFANGKASYRGEGIFADVCRYVDWKIIPAEREFKADAVYQYLKVADETFDAKVPMVNSVAFKTWCGDKWNQYGLLSEYMPKTFLVESKEDLQAHIPKLQGTKGVLKPRRGQKGEHVLVFDADAPPMLDEEVLHTKGYLLQSHADTAEGIPGIVSGIHDIKLITIGDAVFANLRTPEDGRDICTFDSPYNEVAIEDLPTELMRFHSMCKQAVGAAFPGQLYTVDVGLTASGPVLFELNSHTSFPYVHFEYAKGFFDAMLDCLATLH